MPVSDQGVNLESYMLIPRSLIFITWRTKLLLIKGDEDKRLWAGQYNGIGGHIEQGEDIHSAAQRELLEETGITASKLWLCGINLINTKINPGVCLFIFKGETEKSDLIRSNEGALRWFNLSDLGDLPLVSDLPVLLPKILSTKKGDPIFIAYSEYNKADELVIRIE